MKYVRDTTGRFAQRPHYEPAELDDECEGIITQFMRERYGGLDFPLPTEALKVLIERDASDLAAVFFRQPIATHQRGIALPDGKHRRFSGDGQVFFISFDYAAIIHTSSILMATDFSLIISNLSIAAKATRRFFSLAS